MKNETVNKDFLEKEFFPFFDVKLKKLPWIFSIKMPSLDSNDLGMDCFGISCGCNENNEWGIFFISAGKATFVLPVRKDDGRTWLKLGGAVAELSYALLSGDKINENQTDPGFAPRPGQKNKHEICIQLTKKTIIWKCHAMYTHKKINTYFNSRLHDV